jgi:dTDP-4-dehydrorhamnose 3,5-epimerase
MIFEETPLKGAFKIKLEPYSDDRGLFARTFCKNEFQKINHVKEFVQFNHSITKSRGTLRGMHYQLPPFTEIKLIRCVRGSVYDVIIDIREGSPTFLNYFALELSESNMLSIYVPEGFAHGFQTLEDNAQLIYHHTAYYVAGKEGGIRYNDPRVNINWPIPISMITQKDANYSLLNDNFKGIVSES